MDVENITWLNTTKIPRECRKTTTWSNICVISHQWAVYKSDCPLRTDAWNVKKFWLKIKLFCFKSFMSAKNNWKVSDVHKTRAKIHDKLAFLIALWLLMCSVFDFNNFLLIDFLYKSLNFATREYNEIPNLNNETSNCKLFHNLIPFCCSHTTMFLGQKTKHLS